MMMFERIFELVWKQNKACVFVCIIWVEACLHSFKFMWQHKQTCGTQCNELDVNWRRIDNRACVYWSIFLRLHSMRNGIYWCWNEYFWLLQPATATWTEWDSLRRFSHRRTDPISRCFQNAFGFFLLLLAGAHLNLIIRLIFVVGGYKLQQIAASNWTKHLLCRKFIVSMEFVVFLIFHWRTFGMFWIAKLNEQSASIERLGHGDKPFNQWMEITDSISTSPFAGYL